MTSSASILLSVPQQEQLIHKLDIFKIQGRDKRGLKVLRIIGKLFPAKVVSVEALKNYLEEKILPELEDGPFSVVYIHTGVQRCDNFPGIAALRSIYEAIPIGVRDHIAAVYFLHPGIQSRLFLATFGRLLFTGGLYGKVKYVNRLEYLWEHVRRNHLEIPEFVYDHDESLEYRPMMDCGLESDHARPYCAAMAESPVTTYSMRYIA